MVINQPDRSTLIEQLCPFVEWKLIEKRYYSIFNYSNYYGTLIAIVYILHMWRENRNAFKFFSCGQTSWPVLRSARIELP